VGPSIRSTSNAISYGSHWQGSWAQGLTSDWNPDGKVIRKINFKDGRNLFTASNLGDD
jgi:antitoxin component YwqK of YwqJK toxin-antitoxin module